MVNFRNIVVLVPQNKNQFVKLRLQFLKEGLTIMTEPNKGEEGLEASVEFMESLHEYLQQEGIAHEAHTMNCGRNCRRIDRIDDITITLPPPSEPVFLKEKKYRYVAIKPDRRKRVSGGCEVRGIVKAKNTSEAINKLRNIGYFPTEVKIKNRESG